MTGSKLPHASRTISHRSPCEDALRAEKWGGCPPTPVPLDAVSPSIRQTLGAAIRVLHCSLEYAIPPRRPSRLLRAAGGTVYVGSDNKNVYSLDTGS